MQFFKWFWGQ